MTFIKHCLIIMFVLIGLTKTGFASVSVYFDFDDWQAASGSGTAIDFTGYPSFTPITEQYQEQGVLFLGSEYIVNPGLGSLAQDGSGLNGGQSPIDAHFLESQYSVGSHYVGLILFRLFHKKELIYESDAFGAVPGGSFVGFVSDVPFDSAILLDPFDSAVRIDNLYFAPGIPTPGALPILAARLLVRSRRRRC